jgi:Predicted membrane protein (DUF2243)
VTSGRAFVGWMLLGWGLFNLAEGIVDHHIHHVREDVANQWRTTLAFWCSGRYSYAADGRSPRSEEGRVARSQVQ